MAEGEFSLIQQYFALPASATKDDSLILGIGDDAAVMQIPEQRLLVQTMDTLIAGRHFPASTSAEDIAYKSLAVNISDLVAMAATPWSFLLSISLPAPDCGFLTAFSKSIFEAAAEFGIQLIGGDTCKGPLSITIQANGHVAADAYVTRKGAAIGDHIMLSGNIGSAALGLSCLQGESKLDPASESECLMALNRPYPRIDLIEILKAYASSAIDISDGLVSDLGHILEQSGVGAMLDKQALPVIDWIRRHNQYNYALTGGDDYQIVFTVPDDLFQTFCAEIGAKDLDISEIGKITAQGFVLNDDNKIIDLSRLQGFNHFG